MILKKVTLYLVEETLCIVANKHEKPKKALLQLDKTENERNERKWREQETKTYVFVKRFSTCWGEIEKNLK